MNFFLDSGRIDYVSVAWTLSLTAYDAYYLTVTALIRATPRARQPFVISALAHAAYRLSREKRQAIEKNLAAAFGNALAPQDHARIVRGTFYAFWRELFDWSLPPLANEKIECHGIEHLQAAQQNGSGVILWESNGWGARILPKRILHAHGYALCQIHGAKNLGGFFVRHDASPLRQRVKNFFDAREARFTSEILYLPEGDSFAFTRTMLARLQANAILCIAGDGRSGHKFVRVPFLGQSVPFASGTVNLARLAGSPILPLFCHFKENGTWCLRIEPPLALDGAPDRAAATRLALTQYAHQLEQQIRAYPEQYRNWHLVN